jgi:hypothetical protein
MSPHIFIDSAMTNSIRIARFSSDTRECSAPQNHPNNTIKQNNEEITRTKDITDEPLQLRSNAADNRHHWTLIKFSEYSQINLADSKQQSYFE